MALLLVAASAGVLAQAATFDAASVKPNDSGFPGGIVDFRPGQFVATNLTLRDLLANAYDIENYRVVGGPDWLDRDRFDVQARAAAGVPRAQTMPMLQALLADRFTLRARLERRERPIYALVLSRRDGTLGARLRTASADACVSRQIGVRPQPGEPPTCGLLPNGPGRASGRSVTLDLLAAQLSRPLGRVVVNRTGLAGLFDLDLEWAIDEVTRAAVARLTPGQPPSPIDPDLPGLIRAADEQLGLRLESTTGLVDVLVVDSAERPTGN